MGCAIMIYRLSTSSLYKIRQRLSTLFEIPHGEGGFHIQVGETLPRWAADHIAATGSIPDEFKANRDDAPGILIVFYRPANGFIHWVNYGLSSICTG
jgi:hypothetical protein